MSFLQNSVKKRTMELENESESGNITHENELEVVSGNVGVDREKIYVGNQQLVVYTYDDSQEMRCLRRVNPAVMVLAWSVMFIMVFCILFYGVRNSKQLSTHIDISGKCNKCNK